MAIFGIGIDIIEVERVKQAIERSENFKKRVFSAEEIALCDKKPKPYQSYAARFAAKEAVFKAMGTGWIDGMAWTDISVIHDDDNRPVVQVFKKVKEFFDENKIKTVQISLTHLKDIAQAFIILEL